MIGEYEIFSLCVSFYLLIVLFTIAQASNWRLGIYEGSGYMVSESLADRNHRFTASRSSERNVAISTVEWRR